MARLTSKIKEQAILQGAKNGIRPSLLLGVWQAESAFDVYALGDLNSDGAAESYGIGQLHVRGAGGGMHPRKLLVLEVNTAISANFLKRALDAFDGKEDMAVSAYNQGIQGAKDRGLKINQAYVQKVLGFADAFTAIDGEAKKVPTPRTHLVRKGENLWTISQHYYHTGTRNLEIYEANKAVIGPDPDMIHPGMELTIP